jgi:hypothetical protein
VLLVNIGPRAAFPAPGRGNMTGVRGRNGYEMTTATS